VSLFGVIAVIIGIVKRNKIAAILGSSGILFTVILYGGLYYFGFVAKSGPYAELKIQLVGQLFEMNAGKVSLYERDNGELPARLSDLGEPSPDNQYFAVDPWGTEIQYNPKADGTFEFISAGPDRSFDTADDITKGF
jgi:hypothetical protein